MTALGSLVYDTLPNGAGGYITSIAFADDGTLVCTCDTCNGYILEDDPSIITGKKWRPLLRRDNMPSGIIPSLDDGYAPNGDGPGLWFAGIAPSDSNRIYVSWIGRLLRSDDKGLTWSEPNAATHVGLANGTYRLCNPRIAVDPANPDVLFWTSSNAKLFYSADAGATRTDITSRVPAPTSGGAYLVAFDSSSTVTGGKTQRVLVASQGNGVYESTNGGATFSLLAGGPTTPFNFMLVDHIGRIWITLDTSAGVVWLYASSAWTSMTPAGANRQGGVAVDPTDANYVLTVGKWNGTGITKSTDFGTTRTWNSFYTTNDSLQGTAQDIPWLDGKTGSYGMHVFDPTGTTLYYASGLGVWRVDKADIPANRASGDIVMECVSRGIEQLVVKDVICPLTGHPATSQSDRSAMGFTNAYEPPLTFGPDTNLHNASCISYSYIDRNYCAVQVNGTGFSGISTDGGLTWGIIPNCASWGFQQAGGAILVSGPGQILHMASGNNIAKVSFNNGATWESLNITGIADTNVESGWGFDNATAGKRRIGTGDGALEGVFYCANYGARNSSGVAVSGTAGVYRSDLGANVWTKIGSSYPVPGASYQAKLYGVQGFAGHLFFCTGGELAMAGKNLKFATGAHTVAAGGLTWTNITAIQRPFDIGFGTIAPGASYPTIYAIGHDSAGANFGIYRCEDFDPANPNAGTWEFLVDYPLGHLTGAIAIEGDPEEYGRFYMAMGKGSGSTQARTRARFVAV